MRSMSILDYLHCMADAEESENEGLFVKAVKIASGNTLSEYLKTLTSLPRPASGFRIKAYLQMTADQRGIGVFAGEFLPEGTRVDLDLPSVSFTEKQACEFLESAPDDEQRRWWLNHIYCLDGMMKLEITELDISMVNHCNCPTVATKEDGCDYTTRDVNIGEELTEDYRTYDVVPYYDKLCRKYGVDYFNSQWK